MPRAIDNEVPQDLTWVLVRFTVHTRYLPAEQPDEGHRRQRLKELEEAFGGPSSDEGSDEGGKA